MSYVSVPLQSPAGGEDQPASDYLSEKSSPRPRPLGSATTPTVAELGLLPSADSPGVYSLSQWRFGVYKKRLCGSQPDF